MSVFTCILYKGVSHVKADLGEKQKDAGGNSVRKSNDGIEYQEAQMSEVHYVRVEEVTEKQSKARSWWNLHVVSRTLIFPENSMKLLKDFK